jgi:hypothetical protein
MNRGARQRIARLHSIDGAVLALTLRKVIAATSS